MMLAFSFMYICIVITMAMKAVSSFRYGDNCKHIFIDLGCNRGIQIRKLFEPSKFSKLEASIMPQFDYYFSGKREDVCAFSFEPNPLHVLILRELEAVYNSIGFRYKHFAAAVSTQNATMKLLRPNNDFDFAAVLVKNQTLFETSRGRLNKLKVTGENSLSVPVVDFVEFMRRHIISRVMDSGEPLGKVVVKMDIEGEEFVLLPTLIATGVACAGIDAIVTEFHMQQSRRFLDDAMRDETGKATFNSSAAYTMKESFEMMMQIVRYATRDAPGGAGCRTRLVRSDDESYQRATFARKSLPAFPGAPPECYTNGKTKVAPACVLTKPPVGMSAVDHAAHVLQGKRYAGLHSGIV